MSWWNCCCFCTTIYRLNLNGSTRWKANYYFDSDTSVTTANSGRVGQCDIDSLGNVYQVGWRTQTLQNVSALPQTVPMYTLRSWDSTGELRWSWSEKPYGAVVSTNRSGPTPLLSVRATMIGSKPIVVVGDNWNLNVGSSGWNTGNTDGMVNATAIDIDGNQLWRVKLEAGAQLVAAGTTRTLWSRSGGGWIVLRNTDGARMSLMAPTVSFYVYPDSYITNGIVVATMDADDSIFAVLSKAVATSALGLETHYAVGKFESDSLIPSAVVTSQNFYSYTAPYTANCFKKLGVPNAIESASDAVIVASSLGIETFTKSTLVAASMKCMPVSKLLYADAARIGMYDTFGNGFIPPSIHKRDYTRWLNWDVQNTDTWPHPAQATPFRDARKCSDGGSLWSQDFTCYIHEIEADTRAAPGPCAEVCCENCFQSDFPTSYTSLHGAVYSLDDQFNKLNFITLAGFCKGLGSCRWQSGNVGLFISAGQTLIQDATGTGASLNVFISCCTETVGANLYFDIYNQASYRCGAFDCSGGTFTKISDGPNANSSGFPSTVTITPMNCSTPADGHTDCGGVGAFISIPDGAGGFTWVADGADSCTQDCSRVAPSFMPTAANQRTTVGCA
jgi:hypothetical protein